MYFFVLFLQIGAHIPLQCKEPIHSQNKLPRAQAQARVHTHTHTARKGEINNVLFCVISPDWSTYPITMQRTNTQSKQTSASASASVHTHTHRQKR